MAHKPPKPPDTTNESLVKLGSESIGVVLESLRTYAVKAAEVLAETDVSCAESTANHLAQLGARMAQIVAELRKVEHHEQRAAGEITTKALADHLRKMTEHERAAHIRDVQALSRKGSVLG